MHAVGVALRLSILLLLLLLTNASEEKCGPLLPYSDIAAQLKDARKSSDLVEIKACTQELIAWDPYDAAEYVALSSLYHVEQDIEKARLYAHAGSTLASEPLTAARGYLKIVEVAIVQGYIHLADESLRDAQFLLSRTSEGRNREKLEKQIAVAARLLSHGCMRCCDADRARYWRGVAGEILGEQDDDGDDAPLMQICCATTARSAPVFHSISDLPLRAARKVPVAPTASEIESMDRHHLETEMLEGNVLLSSDLSILTVLKKLRHALRTERRPDQRAIHHVNIAKSLLQIPSPPNVFIAAAFRLAVLEFHQAILEKIELSIPQEVFDKQYAFAIAQKRFFSGHEMEYRDRDRDVAVIKKFIKRGTVSMLLPAQALCFSLAQKYLLKLFRDHCQQLGPSRRPAEFNLAFEKAEKALDSPLRIGLFGGDWRENCPVGRSLMHLVPVLAAQPGLSVILFDTEGNGHSELKEALSRQQWVSLPAVIDQTRFSTALPPSASNVLVAETIRKEYALDIAIDMSGWTAGHALGMFAHHLAPIQITWFGLPSSTHCEFMDYLIADAYTVPPASETEKLISETVLRMPHTYLISGHKTAYPHLPRPRDVAPNKKTHTVSLCSINNLELISQDLLRSFMALLASAVAMEEEFGTDNVMTVLKVRTKNARNVSAIDEEARRFRVDHRVQYWKGEINFEDYLQSLHDNCDLMLDSWVQNMHTKTIDCLYAGVPLLTVATHRFNGRFTASALALMGIEDDLVVNSTSSFTEKGRALLRKHMQAIVNGEEEPLLGRLRRILLAARETSPVFDVPAFADDLATLLWKTWNAEVLKHSTTHQQTISLLHLAQEL